jgi:hypothetical protein
MDGQIDNRKRLARLLDDVAVQEGIHQTLVEGVRVARHSEPQPRTPVIYEPMIVVIGQGRKRGYLGDEVYVYDPFNYLVLSVPLPVECVGGQPRRTLAPGYGKRRADDAR